MNRSEIIAGFAVKVLLGLLYGYIYLHAYRGDDTWKMFHASLKETELLLNDPGRFFIREFTPVHSIELGHGWKEILLLYINDLQYALMVKSMALINLITRGNYYVNVAVFNGVAFFGHYWFFKTMTALFPSARKILYFSIFFFLPAVFWLSGYRVEGLLFFFLSLFLLHLFIKKKIYGLVVGFAGIVICRPELAFFVAISTIAYILSRKYGRPLMSFVTVYLAALVLFFAGPWPETMANKQQQFLKLDGTRLPLDTLKPSPAGFIRVLPQALGNTLIRPFPWEANGFLQLLASCEIVLFWSIVIFAILNRSGDWKRTLLQPEILCLLTLGISVYLSIGFIVPFPGAIIRYKAVAELIIIACLVVLINPARTYYYKKQ